MDFYDEEKSNAFLKSYFLLVKQIAQGIQQRHKISGKMRASSHGWVILSLKKVCFTAWLVFLSLKKLHFTA